MTHKLSELKTNIIAAFSAVTHTYDQAAFIEQQIGLNLFERLKQLHYQPNNILDLGCATGNFSNLLQTEYPYAHLTALDLTFAMVNFAKHQQPINPPRLPHFICADGESLPFAAQSFDLIWINCCFNPKQDLTLILREIKRILTIDGLLLFATFGPETLLNLELSINWPDMHDIGDLLLREEFKNPVIDTDKLNIHYSSLHKLLIDLQQSGSYSINLDQAMNLPAEFVGQFEIIYGMAYGSGSTPRQFVQDGKTFIPISSISFKAKNS